jgi:AGZA family xanthine/uracil permease-like MFS transporter
VILLILSLTGISHYIMLAIPHSVKIGTIVGMGLQIALVGMTSVDLIVSNERNLVTLGPIDNLKLWLAFGGLMLIGNLLHHNVQGGILIAITVMTLLSWTIEQSFPAKYLQLPVLQNSISDYINFEEFLGSWQKCLSGVMAFLFILVIDVGGVMFGMSQLAGLTLPNDEVPGSTYAFLGVSLGSMVGAMFGSTPIIVYVETAAGIKEGARTGLPAVVIATLFACSLFLSPVFASIPVAATAPVSIFVGVLMLSQAVEIDWHDLTQAIPAFLTMTLIPFTYSITNGIMFGLLASSIFYVSTGKIFEDLRANNRGSGRGSGTDLVVSYAALDESLPYISAVDQVKLGPVSKTSATSPAGGNSLVAAKDGHRAPV